MPVNARLWEASPQSSSLRFTPCPYIWPSCSRWVKQTASVARDRSKFAPWSALEDEHFIRAWLKRLPIAKPAFCYLPRLVLINRRGQARPVLLLYNSVVFFEGGASNT